MDSRRAQPLRDEGRDAGSIPAPLVLDEEQKGSLRVPLLDASGSGAGGRSRADAWVST
jgi:hypothetical protein